MSGEGEDQDAAPRPLGLAIVRGVHTAIYAVMTASTLALLYAGFTGARGGWLGLALGLLAAESVIFVASGMKCPLSALAVRYGARPDGLFDTFIPERITRHTFHVFAPLMLLGVVLLAVRWWTR
jgi:hypothetical protein